MGNDIGNVFYRIVIDKNLKREEREMLVVLKSLDIEGSNEIVIGRSQLLNIFEVKNKDRIYRVLGNLAEKEYIMIDKSIGRVNKYIFIKDYLLNKRESSIGNVPGGMSSGDVIVPGCVTSGQVNVPGYGLTGYEMVSGEIESGRENVTSGVMSGQGIVPGDGTTRYEMVSGDVGSGRESVPGSIKGGQVIVPGHRVTGDRIVSGEIESGRENVPGGVMDEQVIVPGYGVTGQENVPGYTGTGQESVLGSSKYNNINNKYINNNNNKYINNNLDDVFINIFNHWNKQNISNVESLDLKVKDAITTALSRYPFDTIIESISNYSEVYYSEFFYNIKWNLITFLSSPKGIDKFYYNGCMWTKYQEHKGDKNSQYEEDRREFLKYIDA